MLKVPGVNGVRVVGASIVRTDWRANMRFTCVMIGETAAKRMRAGASLP